jgi:hypothetical protein
MRAAIAAILKPIVGMLPGDNTLTTYYTRWWPIAGDPGQ